jgi:hypothetical protein
MDVNLLSRKEIKSEIKNLINDAILIKGTVAFWTWNIDYIVNSFGKNFLYALKNPESFFCIDISTPITDIDEILNCSKHSENFYVFSYKFKSIKGTPLLHSKITYIECKDSHNVILGSHNNTDKAFGGINFEHSVHIKLSKKLNTEERLFLDKILFELENIKSLCIKFNPSNHKYYKSLYIKPIPIFLNFDSQLINSIQNDSTISIISLDLFDINKDNYKNIYNKDVLLFVRDNYKNEIKYYLAKGESDDMVEQYKMDEKVSSSDFVALKIVSISDRQGLAYPFYGHKNKTIKGSSLNIVNHMIQRVKVIKELSYDDVFLIDYDNKFENIYTEIVEEDLQLLGINESERNNLLKIDKDIYHNKPEETFEKLNSINIENIFESNTSPEIEIDMYDKFDKIFSILFYSDNEDEFSKNKSIRLNKILKILSEGVSNDLNIEFDNTSLNYDTKKLKGLAFNFINDNLIDKKCINKLGQFKTNFQIKS